MRQVLYMISLGFSPASTASVAIASTVGSALGFIAGGWVGDATARRWPDLARPLANQARCARRNARRAAASAHAASRGVARVSRRREAYPSMSSVPRRSAWRLRCRWWRW
jgi:hypothetical protein